MWVPIFYYSFCEVCWPLKCKTHTHVSMHQLTYNSCSQSKDFTMCVCMCVFICIPYTAAITANTITIPTVFTLTSLTIRMLFILLSSSLVTCATATCETANKNLNVSSNKLSAIFCKLVYLQTTILHLTAQLHLQMFAFVCCRDKYAASVVWLLCLQRSI